ncbi:uncharacterized protein LOC108741374 [Agrilus planipennis]|uniref:Uncharacterized protein LOC108741374 n=1 Tax=Agrilus planipennis TaxID=224129 RepID=A0A1W4X6E3_AGRPL|nr:uncharacterized protein LOC108741374 [Agrilus planipennis]
MKISTILFVSLVGMFCCLARCENFPSVHLFLKASKNVPRIGRSMVNNEEFEKFFLKASKSVPRIGRGGDQVENGQKEIVQATDKKSLSTNQALPLWTGIATVYELDPYESPEIALSDDTLQDNRNINKLFRYKRDTVK